MTAWKEVRICKSCWNKTVSAGSSLNALPKRFCCLCYTMGWCTHQWESHSRRECSVGTQKGAEKSTDEIVQAADSMIKRCGFHQLLTLNKECLLIFRNIMYFWLHIILKCLQKIALIALCCFMLRKLSTAVFSNSCDYWYCSTNAHSLRADN